MAQDTLLSEIVAFEKVKSIPIMDGNEHTRFTYERKSKYMDQEWLRIFRRQSNPRAERLRLCQKIACDLPLGVMHDECPLWIVSPI